MTAEEQRVDSFESWRLAIACLRERHLSERAARPQGRAAPGTGDAQTDVRHDPKGDAS